MANKIYTYVPDDVTVSLFGIPLKGFSKDDSIVIERQTPSSDTDRAFDGSGTTYIDQFGFFKVTVKLDQTSESNSFLNIIFRLFRKCGGNLRMPLIVHDKNSGTTFTSLDTFFDGEPQATWGDKNTPYSWTFQCENPSYSISGYDDGAILKSLEMVLNMLDMADKVGFDLTAITDKIKASATTMVGKLDSLLE